MSFPSNDLSPMNHNILSFQMPAGPITGQDMDRQIDTALQTLGFGWGEDAPCTPYWHCTSDADNQGCPMLGASRIE